MRTIYDYAKLSLGEKNLLLSNEAILFDKYEDKGDTVLIYHLDDFFVELTMRNGFIVDNIPYKRGYRFDKKNIHALEKRNAFLNLAA